MTTIRYGPSFTLTVASTAVDPAELLASPTIAAPGHEGTII